MPRPPLNPPTYDELMGLTRRHFLGASALGLGGVALGAILGAGGALALSGCEESSVEDAAEDTADAAEDAAEDAADAADDAADEVDDAVDDAVDDRPGG